MFGVSFQELLLMAVVALLILGPKKLPTALRTVGKYIRKLRNLTSEVRQQSGIDNVLREEGFSGGLNELRSVMRGGTGWQRPGNNLPASQERNPARFMADLSREYPVEGPDAYDVLPEDLLAPAPTTDGSEASSPQVADADASEDAAASGSEAAVTTASEATEANAPPKDSSNDSLAPSESIDSKADS